jgi:trehalose-phosphatase
MLSSALHHVPEIVNKHADRLALFLDYDGTLTPIVARPESATLSESKRDVLRTLAAKVPVVILSGRDLDDLRSRVDIGEIIYGGSHGFDIAGPGGLRKQVATEFLPILDAVENELHEKIVAVPGGLIERKKFSVAAHYRQTDRPGAITVSRAVQQVASVHPELRCVPGKKVYELQPDVDWNKGLALIWLLGCLRRDHDLFPIYVGDDQTDEDAFRALPRYGVGILVTARPRQTAARYMLRGSQEVERLLGEIAAQLSA